VAIFNYDTTLDYYSLSHIKQLESDIYAFWGGGKCVDTYGC